MLTFSNNSGGLINEYLKLICDFILDILLFVASGT